MQILSFIKTSQRLTFTTTIIHHRWFKILAAR